jgi:O-antigen ligase/tetratricopeptide (TPR) repeat protein
MPVVASLFLSLSVILAVTLGGKFLPFAWGPSLLALGIAAIAALQPSFRKKAVTIEAPTLLLGLLVFAWFAWRAWVSPVWDLALADLLLLAAAAAAFLVIRIIEISPASARTFLWGFAAVLLASIIVIAKQKADPEYFALLPTNDDKLPSGFFGHYSYGAHFLIGGSLLLGGVAALGKQPRWERIAWGLVAIGGIVGIYFTRSRGGYVGAGAGLLAWTVVITLIGLRRKAKWAPPMAIFLPIACIILAVVSIKSLGQAQQDREMLGGVKGMMDNNVRLYLLGIAASCIGLHPIAGGGARSFSWECYRFWDRSNQGYGTNRPEHVHNELVQSATDYGLLGAGLLITLIATIAIASLLRSWMADNESMKDSDGWRLGGLAALAGILVHSCFEGVLRTAPGAICFGIALAACCYGATAGKLELPMRRIRQSIVLILLAACTAWLIPNAWQGSRIFRELWPTHFSKNGPTSIESRIDALTRAIEISPSEHLLLDRATSFQEASVSKKREETTAEWINLAIADYRTASERNPYNPIPAINLATLLSLKADDRAAEAEFARTIRLQGGMEAGFLGHYSFAGHLLQKGLRYFQSGDITQAHISLEWAASEIEQAHKDSPNRVVNERRVIIHESLGVAREAMEDPEGAIESYEFAAAIPGGVRAHYRIGVLIGKSAVIAWNERRSAEALFLFKEALRRSSMTPVVPEGVTNDARKEYLNYLVSTIRYLEGAGIQPTAPTNE